MKDYVSQVEGGPHLFQSCLCAAQDGFLHVAREMQLSFESLIVTDALGLHASWMDMHHNTSFRSILKDDSISLTSKGHIYSCSSKGVGKWLVVRPSKRSFCITHAIFVSVLPFRFGLI